MTINPEINAIPPKQPSFVFLDPKDWSVQPYWPSITRILPCTLELCVSGSLAGLSGPCGNVLWKVSYLWAHLEPIPEKWVDWKEWEEWVQSIGFLWSVFLGHTRQCLACLMALLSGISPGEPYRIQGMELRLKVRKASSLPVILSLQFWLLGVLWSVCS